MPVVVSVCLNNGFEICISVKSNYGETGPASINVLVLAPSYRRIPQCVEILAGKYGFSMMHIFSGITLRFYFNNSL